MEGKKKMQQVGKTQQGNVVETRLFYNKHGMQQVVNSK